MKLSHLLIATLVTSSLMAMAQNEPKVKKQKSNTEKKNKKKAPIYVENLKTDSLNIHPKFHCPACGRG